MSYTMYTPLNVWLDPASVTDVVAYIQNYLSENTIYSEEEIEELIHDYLIAHPELIGGVQSVNGKTGTVVLTASDINTENNVTIESVLASLSSQISSIASSVATNTANITNLTGRVTTAETDISNLKSNINPILGIVSISGWTEGYYINESGTVTQNANLMYSDAIKVDSNSVYILKGKRTTGASNVRIYGYSSENMNDKVQSLYSLSQPSDYNIEFNTRDATYIRISVKIADTDITLISTSDNIQNQVDDIKEYTKGVGIEFDNWITNKSITSNVDVGAYVNTELNDFNNSDCQIIKCTKGDIFYYSALGAGQARAWAFLDDECYLISKTSTTFRFEENVLVAPGNGWLVCNAYRLYDNIERTHKLIRIYDASSIIKSNNTKFSKIVSPYIPPIFETIDTLPYDPNALNWQTGDPSSPQFKGAYDRVIAGYDSLLTIKNVAFPNVGYYINASGAVMSDATFKYSDAIPVTPNTDYVFKGDYSSTSFNFRIHGFSSTDVSDWNNQISSTLVTTNYEIKFNSGNNTYIRINMTVANSNPTTIMKANESYYVTKQSMGYDQSGTIEMFRYDFVPRVPSTNLNVNYAEKHIYTGVDFPVIISNTGMHGDEKPDVYSHLNMMTLIANAKGNDIFGWLKNNIHFVVVPFENPYGFQHQTRGNSRGVDLNRNFPVYWELDPNADRDDPTNSRYRGTAAGSEAETQHIIEILNEFKGKALCYYSWHTHGVYSSFEKMTCYQLPKSEFYDECQNIGISLIKAITHEGWKNQQLNENSGFIGIIEVASIAGVASNTGVSYGIPSACPEVMYRYYDGGSGAILNNNNVNCMNVLYMMYAIALLIKETLFTD